jgi:cytochrome P450
VQKVLKALLKERLGTVPRKRHGDFLDHVVDEVENGKGIIDEKLGVDLVSALLFGSFATLAPALTLAMKFLTDNPNVVEALKVNFTLAF